MQPFLHVCSCNLPSSRAPHSLNSALPNDAMAAMEPLAPSLITHSYAQLSFMSVRLSGLVVGSLNHKDWNDKHIFGFAYTFA